MQTEPTRAILKERISPRRLPVFAPIFKETLSSKVSVFSILLNTYKCKANS